MTLDYVRADAARHAKFSGAGDYLIATFAPSGSSRGSSNGADVRAVLLTYLDRDVARYNQSIATATRRRKAVELTLHIPEDLASRLRPVEDRLPQILELGLRELHAEPLRFEGLGDVLETLARLPTPQEVLALRPSATFQERISALVDRQRSGGLSDDEEREWEQYKYVEHLVRIAKAKAALKLKPDGTP
jgi:hypothetical protein